MKLVAVVLLLAAALPSPGAVSLASRDDSWKVRPVSKVITLLKDMQKSLEKEAKEDEEIYDKLACWCETNDREKTQAIADAESRIKLLRNRIEELTALSAQLSAEIAQLEKEVAANQAALDQATALRQKQLAEFNAEEKDLLGSIGALKSAVAVLSKHHGGSLLQRPGAVVQNVAAMLKRELDRHDHLLRGVLTHTERVAAAAFVQAMQASSGEQPTFKQAYAPQSGQIFGILKQMQETFESNLAEAQKAEHENQKSYEELKAAKENEIAAGKAQISSKSNELADTDEKLAHDKQDLEDTTNTLSADSQFLMMLKEKCTITDKEWEERQTTRNAEIQAVSKALAVLSSDDAHDLFTRTFNPALLQTHRAVESQRRVQAAQVLSAAAKRLHNPKLSTLAYQVRLDAFTRVKKAIDDLISQLLRQKEDEIKHKDFCVDELNTNQLQTEKKERESEDLTHKIEDLQLRIKELSEAIEKLKGEIAELQVQLKRAGEIREQENKEFQSTVADQRETQKLLHQAIDALGEFYGKPAAMLAQKQPAGPPPPSGFKEYKQKEASAGVVGLLQQIIDDAKAAETEAIRAEDEGQKAYEGFVKDTNNAIDAKNTDIANKSEDKAKTEGDLVETQASKSAVGTELENLSNYNAQLHHSCDFVLKNFDLRQAARDEEVEALKQAKSILSGANFEGLLQKA